jgi:hypothetical protein
MLDKSFGLLFYLKKPKNHGKGPIPIYLRITVNGVAKEISTKRSCDTNRWNPAAERISGTKEDAKALNAYLDTLKAKTYEAKRQFISMITFLALHCAFALSVAPKATRNVRLKFSTLCIATCANNRTLAKY